MISFDDFKKVEIRAGKILSAEKIPATDKLVKLMVDFGESEEDKTIADAGQSVSGEKTGETVAKVGDEAGTAPAVVAQKIPKPRQIVSGIALYFPDLTVLVGKTCMFVTNLEPRMIKGFESNGMLFAVSNSSGGFSLLEPNSSILPGTLAI